MRSPRPWVALLLALGLLPVTATAQRHGQAWTVQPEVVVFAPADDRRVGLVREAVAYWNEQLAALASPFRLGSVKVSEATAAAQDLQALSALMVAGPVATDAVPESLRQLPGDITFVLTELPLVSFAGPLMAGHKRVLALRGSRLPPLDRPNVTRNVIAHELGHAIGLLHNADPNTLMCGRPAPCRPELFESGTERFFPLSPAEAQALLAMYPRDWTPRPR